MASDAPPTTTERGFFFRSPLALAPLVLTVSALAAAIGAAAAVLLFTWFSP